MGDKKNGYKMLLGILKEINQWEDMRLRGDYIKFGIKVKEWEGVDWIHLTQDGDQWWDIVNTTIHLGVS
jgi:hypothetical protein